VLAIIPFIPLLLKVFARMKGTFPISRKKTGTIDYTGIFILSMAVFFLLGGFFVPSALIASSVQEFSFIENYESPFPFIAHTALQSFGIFLLWPLCIYYIFPQKIKKIIAIIASILAGITMVNVFLFPGKYGIISLMFILSINPDSNFTGNFLNILTITIITILILLFTRYFRKIILSSLIIVSCALLTVGAMSCIKIFNEFQPFQLRYKENMIVTGEPVYKFSKTGKNVLVIMLDMALSGYVPYIFEENPELYDSYDGFVWYKNTVSFGKHTMFGAPAIFGGYDFTPIESNARANIPLAEKHSESLLMLPRIFLDHDFKVTVTDPPSDKVIGGAELSIFDDYPQIHAENIIGKYNKKSSFFYGSNNNIVTDADGIIKSYLIRFSFFKFVPLFLRNFVYNDGKWLSTNEKNIINIPITALNNYIALDILPDITEINEETYYSYTALTNNLTHDPHLPGHIPSIKITNNGNGFLSDEIPYYSNVSAFVLLGKWLDYFKDNNVYDNTRIIIVSDHGVAINSKMADNILLPNGDHLEYLAALLFVKDFDSKGILSINDSFMTNADVPLIALDGVVENPVNPWTGKIIENKKDDGIILTSTIFWFVPDLLTNGYSFNIKPDEWLHVHTNIFDPENWSKVQR
jgi:hypothetical protein